MSNIVASALKRLMAKRRETGLDEQGRPLREVEAEIRTPPNYHPRRVLKLPLVPPQSGPDDV